jgi:hypothetical protein
MKNNDQILKVLHQHVDIYSKSNKIRAFIELLMAILTLMAFDS